MIKTTAAKFNWCCFFVGMAVVWFATHNWVAIVGAWIASIHLNVIVKEDDDGK